VHEIAHGEQQSSAQAAAGMRERKVFGGEAAGLEKRYRQGVAQDQGSGGRCGRRQVQRAGFTLHA